MIYIYSQSKSYLFHNYVNDIIDQSKFFMLSFEKFCDSIKFRTVIFRASVFTDCLIKSPVTLNDLRKIFILLPGSQRSKRSSRIRRQSWSIWSSWIIWTTWRNCKLLEILIYTDSHISAKANWSWKRAFLNIYLFHKRAIVTWKCYTRCPSKILAYIKLC